MAHFKNAIEFLDANEFGKPANILYKELELKSKNGAVQYLNGGYCIYYSPELDIAQRRMVIGHELSHILLSVLDKEIYNPKSRKYEKEREFLATMISYIIIIEQGNHYESTVINDFIYDDDNKKRKLLGDMMEIIHGKK